MRVSTLSPLESQFGFAMISRAILTIVICNCSEKSPYKTTDKDLLNFFESCVDNNPFDSCLERNQE